MVDAAVKNPTAHATGTMAKMAGNNYWFLMLDLDGHSHIKGGRGWTLVGPGPEHHTLNGRITTPQRVVQQVCKIAKGVGGKMDK
jgi:hypothetical protein